jgi:hypothetical protein
VTNNRWHIIDSLPFQSRIAFYMELFSHYRTPGFTYARLGYHYARPGIIDDHLPITSEDVRHLELPAWQPLAKMGAAGSEFYQAEDIVADKANTSFIEGNLWAGGKALLWKPAGKHESLVLNISVSEDGRYSVNIVTLRSPQSGSFSVRIDGEPVKYGEGIVDLYVPYRTLSRNARGPRIELSKGTHKFELRYEGSTHDIAEPVIGLDFVWVQRQR